MTTHKAAQSKTFSPARESDCGNLQGVIGYVPGTMIYGEGAVLADNDTIQMVKIPLGATVMEVILETGAMGTNALVQVGDGSDPNRYIVDAGHASAALTRRNSVAPDQGVGIPYTYTDEDTIDAVFTNANPSENIGIRLDVFYICGVDVTP